MSNFENFILSDAFFPILIILLIALVGVFIWIIKSNKKNYYHRVHHTNTEKTEEELFKEVLSDAESITDDELEFLLNGKIYEMPELKKEEKKENDDLVSLNNNDSNLIVEQVSIENEKEDIKDENMEINNEVLENNSLENLDNNLNINNDSNLIMEDPIQENIKLEEKINNYQEENVDIKEENIKINNEILENNDLGNLDNNLDDINQFPDFSAIEDLTKKETVENSKIEEDIMNAANKYIESIMSNK